MHRRVERFAVNLIDPPPGRIASRAADQGEWWPALVMAALGVLAGCLLPLV